MYHWTHSVVLRGQINGPTYVALLLSVFHTASWWAQCYFGRMGTRACLLDYCSPGQSEVGIKMEKNQLEESIRWSIFLHIQHSQNIYQAEFSNFFSYTLNFSSAKWQKWVNTKKKNVLKEKCCLPMPKAAIQKQCHSRADSAALPFLCSIVVLHQQYELQQKPKRNKRTK